MRKYFSENSVIYHFISLLGIMTLAIGYFETKTIIRLSLNGVSTTATVTWVEHVISSSSYSPDIQYHVSYFAKNPDADTTLFFKDKMHFGRLLHLHGSTLKEGDTFLIRYNPEHPEEIKFDLPLSVHLRKVRVWGVWLMGLCLLVGGRWLWITALKKPEYLQ